MPFFSKENNCANKWAVIKADNIKETNAWALVDWRFYSCPLTDFTRFLIQTANVVDDRSVKFTLIVEGLGAVTEEF